MNNLSLTPLRYPGGKTKLAPFLEDLIALNDLNDGTLYELYAGGAGASLKLLEHGWCSRLVLNDLDIHIYSFWKSVLDHTDEIVRLITDTEVTIEEWLIQKHIYSNPDQYDLLAVGFSTFFLNRTNRSGILFKAGPIGGKNQTGNYKMDVRYNKKDLISRIERIARLKSQITVHNTESIEFLKEIFSLDDSNYLIFLDPPYFDQGEALYFNHYRESDHSDLKDLLSENRDKSWVLTYDNCTDINHLYRGFRRTLIDMPYTLQAKRKAKEVMMLSDNLTLPPFMKVGTKKRQLLLESVEL